MSLNSREPAHNPICGERAVVRGSFAQAGMAVSRGWALITLRVEPGNEFRGRSGGRQQLVALIDADDPARWFGPAGRYGHFRLGIFGGRVVNEGGGGLGVFVSFSGHGLRLFDEFRVNDFFLGRYIDADKAGLEGDVSIAATDSADIDGYGANFGVGRKLGNPALLHRHDELINGHRGIKRGEAGRFSMGGVCVA